ncbi:MAG: beta-lactamase family protein [Gammaproteobacteria bacterium]|nr:beta-lactamase family protein [Gammaproteobacteria bacterium]
MKLLLKIVLGIVIAIFSLMLIGYGIIKYIDIPPLKLSKDAALDTKTQVLDEWLAELHDRRKFNGSVLIVKNGNIVFDKSYGYADLERTVALTNRSSFNLASVSKQFTAMGVLMLAEKGKIDLAQEISFYLPELDYDNLTVKHLLNHTSGIASYMELANQHWNDQQTFKNSDLLALFDKHQPPLTFQPGEQFEYSNTGYVVLASLIEKVSGQSFEQYMDDNIFKPLNMEDSSVFNLLSSPNKLTNRVFGVEGDQLNDLVYLDGVAGDGAVYSSTLDLLKWSQALDSHQLISQNLLNEAYSQGVLNSGEKTGYGYGWVVSNEHTVEHDGSWVGFNTYLKKDIKNDNVLIVLDSGSNYFSSAHVQRKLSESLSSL